jgi:hypothetical protein
MHLILHASYSLVLTGCAPSQHQGPVPDSRKYLGSCVIFDSFSTESASFSFSSSSFERPGVEIARTNVAHRVHTHLSFALSV